MPVLRRPVETARIIGNFSFERVRRGQGPLSAVSGNSKLMEFCSIEGLSFRPSDKVRQGSFSGSERVTRPCKVNMLP